MKKILITITLGLLILTGCSTTTEDTTTPNSTSETMQDETMQDETPQETTSDNMDDEMMNEGSMAPNFEYTTFDGETVTLSDFSGQKVYIKYWASWCPICLSGLERLDELFASVDDDSDYQILTVVTPGYNNEVSEEDFKTWYNGLDYENITVLFDYDGEYAKEFNVRGVPTSIFIGSDGILISSLAGDKSNEDVFTTLDSFN